jgi:acetamidase/formamidase
LAKTGVIHELPLERRTIHGHFSCAVPPVLTIDSGDTIRLSTLQGGWFLEPGVFLEPRDPEVDSGHPLCGPVEVQGARAGQTLEIRIGSLRPSWWGATVAEGEVVPWTLDADAHTGRTSAGRVVELRPFLGVLGMPPPEQGMHSTVPPRRWGGNLDCKELVAGTRLFLPIPVDGALFSAGDGHARQGDGEVSGSGIECGMEHAELTLFVRDDLPLDMPLAWTPEAWITFGLDEDLDRAAHQATEEMLALLGREHGVDRPEALALASVVVDLRVTQIVNEVCGVHALLPHDALRG